MDNFRKHRPVKKSASIDGFISSSDPKTGDNDNRPKLNRNRMRKSAQSVDGLINKQTNAIPQMPAKPLGRQPKRNAMGKIDLTLPDSPPKTKRSRFKFNKNTSLKVAAKAFMIVMVAGVLTGGYLFGKGYLTLRQAFRGGTAGASALYGNADPSTLNGEGDGRVNILLLGKGGEGHEAPDLTDTILVASIDPIHNEAALLSIPRDLWVDTQYGGSKINAVYANAMYAAINAGQGNPEEAGLDAIEQTVEDTMGIPIHYQAMIDFKGFKKAINTLGGIDIHVEEPLYEVMRIDGRQYVLDVRTGRQHFDGTRALAYARSRMTSTRGDFDRAERQRLVLIGMKQKVFSLGTFGNPGKVSQLISDFGNHMTSNLELGEVLRLYEIGQNIDIDKISSVGLADPPNNYVQTANIAGQSVVVPTAGVGDFSEIRSYVRNTLKDGYIRDENATIAVYNGTGVTGLAGRSADYLRSYGYNINQVADAPTKGYAKTVLVDLTNGEKKYTKAYLEKRLNTSAVSSLPDNSINPENADFVIILGSNESSNF